ncbi:hypothetical protein RJ640_013942 [Escallonia rubra]|uniref:Uncharacterized protein n=1 Tax=Escallonia rubra TaxID=112253 RepID=A0AA88U7V5_9ASTE|nr:hypothetical protein RJ640_013942 [Escallonia rubra]
MAEVAEGEVLPLMRQRGVDPEVLTWILHARPDGRTTKTFDSMIDLGLVPDVYTYKILINGYCKQCGLLGVAPQLARPSPWSSAPRALVR